MRRSNADVSRHSPRLHLKSITHIISRMDWYCTLAEHILSQNNMVVGKESFKSIQLQLENRVVELYKVLILYQMKSVCFFYLHQGWVFPRGLANINDWDIDLKSITDAEAILQKDLNQFSSQDTKSFLGKLVEEAEKRRAMLKDMYPYIPLPDNSVRLLRLLPPSSDKSRIEFQLITCSLLGSKRSHSYEALSYVWGLGKSKESIWIDGNELSVGANLYTALSHLRDCFVERILWIDAICINQRDDEEKGHQVRSMAKIYAKASRVLVWLGEAADDSNHALKAIRRAAKEQDTDSSTPEMHQQASFVHSDRQPIDSETSDINKQAVLALLEREWFQRIWVLQEVAAARHVLIKCGTAEIDGYAFCVGLSALNLSYETRPHLQGLIPPIAVLIRGAVFRPRYEGDQISRQDRFSLNIRPLCELVDMYHTHKASFLLDKVYALLGMSNDNPYEAGLETNYDATWRDVFRKLVHFCLSDQMSVSTWDRAEAAVIEAKGYILGEVSSAKVDAPQHDRQNHDVTRHDRQYVDITWKNAPGYIDGKGKQSSRFTFQASAKAIKEGDVVCLLQGASRPTIVRLCDDFSTIIINAFPLTDNLRKCHGPWREADEEALRIMDDPYIGDSQELLSWSAKVIIQRLAGKGANIELKDQAGRTPLLYAAEKGHEAIVRLLLDKGAKVEMLGLGGNGRTALSYVAEKGQEAVVRLVLDKGASVEALGLGGNGRTALSYAAENGYEAIVRLLLDKGAKVEALGLGGNGRTALSYAAENGYEAVTRLLINKGARIDLADDTGRTLLFYAVERGHEAVARLLIDRSASNLLYI
ncbi:hypothetical protein B0T25DRAFT_597508 [Lasiosphaeria hispida]|uniref:Heterokaryon incompatibility domain-containing protein n=1 Tax=Lasiosphaeria hispida TaxID=260671 RepID=A0AAJ0HW09_9PEZI|nr:hypothetical protein B0T25DRAFT_597508 [Lasiosphaeria hispida]